jgi:hypothetical protein
MGFIGQTIGIASAPDLLVKNVPCSAAVLAGQFVRVDTNNGLLIPADSGSIEDSLVLGLVEEKFGPGFCSVRLGGLSKSLFSGLNLNKPLFLGSQGSFSYTIPTTSGSVVLRLGTPFNDSQIVLNIQERLMRS